MTKKGKLRCLVLTGTHSVVQIFVNVLISSLCPKKALDLEECTAARLKWAKTKMRGWSKWECMDPQNPYNFGYDDCCPLTEYHLQCLLCYCSLAEFQRSFIATYRKKEDGDGVEEIKERHSNFHHFAKYLKEAVQVFGTEYKEGIIERVFHGFDKTMVFDGLYANIYSVLSTTFEKRVAIGFSKGSGMIIQMIPNPKQTCFRCDWLSPFHWEGELLFIGGWAPMMICNITDASSGKEAVLMERYGMSRRYPHDGIQEKGNMECLQMALPHLTVFQMKVCVGLLYHELNRNGYQRNKYPKCPLMDPYVDALLHQICQNNQMIYIDWKSMKKMLHQIEENG